jgi:hypothetical protein
MGGHRAPTDGPVDPVLGYVTRRRVRAQSATSRADGRRLIATERLCGIKSTHGFNESSTGLVRSGLASSGDTAASCVSLDSGC